MSIYWHSLFFLIFMCLCEPCTCHCSLFPRRSSVRLDVLHFFSLSPTVENRILEFLIEGKEWELTEAISISALFNEDKLFDRFLRAAKDNENVLKDALERMKWLKNDSRYMKLEKTFYVSKIKSLIKVTHLQLMY